MSRISIVSLIFGCVWGLLASKIGLSITDILFWVILVLGSVGITVAMYDR